MTDEYKENRININLYEKKSRVIVYLYDLV